MSDPLTIGPSSAPLRNSSAHSNEAVGAIDAARIGGGTQISREHRIAATMRLAADLAALPPIGEPPTSATSGRPA